MPAEGHNNVEANRRAEERIAILGDLKAEVTIHQQMDIVEISPTGLQVITSFPLRLDALHDIRLTLGPHILVVKGRITHCHVTDMDEESVRYRSGIECTDIAAHIQSAIVEFVETVKTARNGEARSARTATSD